MKLNRIILILMLISISVVCGQSSKPTKQETEQWIKSVVHTYGGQVEFKDGKIISNNTFDPIFKHVRYEAQLKDLGGVRGYDFTDEIRAIGLGCYKPKCSQMSDKMDNFEGKMENSFVDIQLSGIPIDLETRLIKAFNHLIKLYGGKTIDNKF